MNTYSRTKADEQEEVISDLSEYCRLCMTKEERLVSIFDNDAQVPLTLRIMACVSLEVIEGDGLPNKICHPCKYQLEKSYTFRKKCEGSHIKLRQHVSTIQQKFPDMGVKFQQDPVIIEVDEDEGRVKEEEEELTAETDLAGVTQVSHISPAPGFEADDITLPTEDDPLQEDKRQFMKSMIDADETHEPMIEDQQLNFIADLQLKVEEEPTQVSVTTEDGSMIRLDVLPDAQDQPLDHDQQQHAHEDDDPVMSDDGELKSLVHKFGCGSCEKKFAYRSVLVRHQRTHTGERPFQCEVCQRSFAQKENLRVHIIVHTGERPFQCEVCQRSFSLKRNLRTHMQRHTDERPFQCKICPKSFMWKRHQSRHQLTHVEAGPAVSEGDIMSATFTCKTCNTRFKEEWSLRRHIRRFGHQD